MSGAIIPDAATFSLDARLRADTGLVGELGLSRVLLLNDARYDWLVLVPRQSGLVELSDLGDAEYATVCSEIRRVSQVLQSASAAHKINIGALGNIVRQLHIHIVARHEGDAAWPGPVWGAGQAQPRSAAALAEQCARWRQLLSL